MRGLFSGKRATLIDWITVWAIFAVFSVVLYRGLVGTWQENGLPPLAHRYLKWEKQHTPRWFVNLFLD